MIIFIKYETRQEQEEPNYLIEKSKVLGKVQYIAVHITCYSYLMKIRTEINRVTKIGLRRNFNGGNEKLYDQPTLWKFYIKLFNEKKMLVLYYYIDLLNYASYIRTYIT